MSGLDGESPNDFPPQPILHVAIKGLCPRCGQGRLFSSFLKVDQSCSHCNLDFSKANVGDGAIPFIMLIVGFIGVGAGVWLQFKFDSPFWVQILVTFPIIICLTLGLMQPSKALLLALEYKQKAGEGGSNTFDAED
ncbi:MAG: DUF983 domain-containing protein [Alphaproteobacteria bacterium]|nr:DUF983 domain-containing protein [Alphaproteobacteria bacterium]